MARLMLCAVLVCALVIIMANCQIAPATVNPEEEATKFADIGEIIMQSRVQKANLPDDLLADSLEVILNSRTSFAGCKSTLDTNHVIWQYRLCVVSNLKLANLAISQLETEARNREAIAATTV